MCKLGVFNTLCWAPRSWLVCWAPRCATHWVQARYAAKCSSTLSPGLCLSMERLQCHFAELPTETKGVDFDQTAPRFEAKSSRFSAMERRPSDKKGITDEPRNAVWTVADLWPSGCFGFKKPTQLSDTSNNNNSCRIPLEQCKRQCF